MCWQTWLAGGALFLLCPRRASSVAFSGLPFRVQPTALRATPARFAASLNGHGYRRDRSGATRRRSVLRIRRRSPRRRADASLPALRNRHSKHVPPGRLQAAACSGTILPPTCPGCHRNPHPLADRRPTRPRLSHNLLARRAAGCPPAPHAVWLRHFGSVVRAPLFGESSGLDDADAAPPPWPSGEPCGSALECRQALTVKLTATMKPTRFPTSNAHRGSNRRPGGTGSTFRAGRNRPRIMGPLCDVEPFQRTPA
jgi:hypothetical protein